LIPLAVGLDLAAEEQQAFDDHLRRCLSCYREYRDYVDALAALDPLRAPAGFEAPEGLAEAIVAEVRAGEPGPLAPHPTPFWARPSRTIRYGLPLAAAAVVFTLAGLFVSQFGKRPEGHVPQMPKIFDAPVVTPIVNDPPDQFGPAYVFPESIHPGRLRRVEGPLRMSEPLPTMVVPINKRNDY